MNCGLEESGVPTQKYLQLFGPAGPARFLVLEVRQGSRFHEALKRDGENLAGGVKTLYQGAQIHIGGELAVFHVEQLCFKFGHTAEAPSSRSASSDTIFCSIMSCGR